MSSEHETQDARRQGREHGDAVRPGTQPAAPDGNSVQQFSLVALALVVGAAGGWVAHRMQAPPVLSSEPYPTPAVSGSAAPEAPCEQWKVEICDGVGDSSIACKQASGAAELLPVPACEAALGVVPATLARIKASRIVCDELADRLCGELGDASPTCSLVRRRTSKSSPQRCRTMVSEYDSLLERLRRMAERGRGAVTPFPDASASGNPRSTGRRPLPPQAAPATSKGQ